MSFTVSNIVLCQMCVLSLLARDDNHSDNLHCSYCIIIEYLLLLPVSGMPHLVSYR